METYGGVLGPLGEAVGVEGKLALEILDDVLVLEEENSAVAGGEALDAALGRGELVLGHDALEHVQGDVPELLVLVPKEEDGLHTAARSASDARWRGKKKKRGGGDVRGCSGC